MTVSLDNLDHRWMRAALSLAQRGIGRTWPNPAVGCILYQPGDPGCVVGRGWTQPGGRPHAETEALDRAGKAARGATAYLTLEPCAHTAETAPCADALINSGIARAVIAVEDPDPRVSGAGIMKLQKAGIKTDIGCLSEMARELNAGFFKKVSKGRPFVAWKTATTLDGQIAGEVDSQWISGVESRARAHLLRARFDAVLTGMGTVIGDDPKLTCRLLGLEERSPIRVVMLGKRPLPRKNNLVATSKWAEIWVYKALKVEPPKFDRQINGMEIINVGGDVWPDPEAVLSDLAMRGITRVMVEAGTGIAASFFDLDLIDEIHWFRAPKVMGADGVSAIGKLGPESLVKMSNFERVKYSEVGMDTYEIYQRKF